MNQDTFSKIQEVVGLVFKEHNGEVLPGFSSADIAGWDSLGHINLVLALEEKFGVRLRPAQLARLVSLEAIADHIDGKLA